MTLTRMREIFLFLTVCVVSSNALLHLLNSDRPRIFGMFAKPNTEEKSESVPLSHSSSEAHRGSIGIQIEVKPLGILGGFIDHAKKVIGRPAPEESTLGDDEEVGYGNHKPPGHGGGSRPGYPPGSNQKPPGHGNKPGYPQTSGYPSNQNPSGHGSGNRPVYPHTGGGGNQKPPGHANGNRPAYPQAGGGGRYPDKQKPPVQEGGNKPEYGDDDYEGDYDGDKEAHEPGNGGNRPNYDEPPRGSGHGHHGHHGHEHGHHGHDHHDHHGRPIGHGHWGRPGYKPPRGHHHGNRGHHKPGRWGNNRPGQHEDNREYDKNYDLKEAGNDEPPSVNEGTGQPPNDWVSHPANPKPQRHGNEGSHQKPPKESEPLESHKDDEDRKPEENLPSWDDIGEESTKTDPPFLDLINPRQKPRPKRHVDSKIYHVRLEFRSNARPFGVKIHTENESGERDEKMIPVN